MHQNVTIWREADTPGKGQVLLFDSVEQPAGSSGEQPESIKHVITAPAFTQQQLKADTPYRASVLHSFG